MILPMQSNKISGKDWLKYHPYSTTSFVDNYYLNICNKIFKIIHDFEFSICFAEIQEKKSLACILTAYFEDIISETRLFSSFTSLHKKIYGKELPFYKIADDYDPDDINIQDIHFLIWYSSSVNTEETIRDSYFISIRTFDKITSAIYDLFDNEFENAPQNEKMQEFLQLPENSSVDTIRQTLAFIAHNSFLWKDTFSQYLEQFLSIYKKGDKIVLDENGEAQFYDWQIDFIFNGHLPLLAMRAPEYFAEILGEEHAEYHFIKNISKRIFSTFLIVKIEEKGFFLEHFLTKQQLWLSNEYTSLEGIDLQENRSILLLGLVKWKDDIWQNQGLYMVKSITDINLINDLFKIDKAAHLFEDEDKKKEIILNLENAFLEINNGKRMIYPKTVRHYADFYAELLRKCTQKLDHTITKGEVDKAAEDNASKVSQDIEIQLKERKEKAFCVFFNPIGGPEIYFEAVTLLMADKDNPSYVHKKIDLPDLLTNRGVSKEFMTFVIENQLMEMKVTEYANPDLLTILLENYNFLLRFYRKKRYFTKPEVTILDNYK